MPDREELQNDRFNRISEEVKKDQIQKKHDKETKYKQEMELIRQQKLATLRDELNEEGIGRKTKEGNVSKSQAVIDEAKRMQEEGVRAFDDWRSCMMALLVLSKSALGAMIHARKELQYFLTEDVPDWAEEKMAKTELGRKVLSIPQAIREAFRRDVEMELPTLRYNVQCAEDGTVKIEPLQLANTSEELSEEINKLFREGVCMWLEEQGYTAVEGQPGKFVSTANGSPLTQEDFNDLADDEVNGLESFLSRQPGDVDYVPTRPAP